MRERRRRLRRLAHGPDRDARARGAEAFLQRLLSNDVAKLAVGGAQYSVLCREDGGVLDDLFTYRLADDRYLTVTNAANHEQGPRLVRSATAEGFDVEVTDAADRLRDARRPGPAAPASSSRRSPTARCPTRFRAGERRCSPARRMLVCGTGYTGEDGVELLLRPRRRRRRLGRARAPRRHARRPGRARHAAPRGLLPPLRQRPDGGRAARSRPASAGAARRTPASSAPTRCARRARPGPPRSSSRSAHRRPGHRAPGQPGRRRRRGHQRHACRPCSSVGIGMAYLPAERARRGTEFEIDVRGKTARRPSSRSKPLYRHEEDDRWPTPATPTTCSTTPSTTGPASTATPPRSGSPGTPRTRSARSCSSTRPRSAATVTEDESYTEVESVKAVSDVIAPLSGEIVEVNDRARRQPEAINDDPYGDGLDGQGQAVRRRPSATRCSTTAAYDGHA